MTVYISNYKPFHSPITIPMTALFDNLKMTGLTENQTTVYLALAKTGEAKAGELIKKTGIHRNIVYTSLDELTEKGLVAQSRVKGVTLYKLLSPTRLLANAQERERAAKNAIEELRQLTNHRSEQQILVYEGIDEFRQHIVRSYSIAAPGETLRYIGISPEWHTIAGPTLEKEMIAIHKEKHLTAKCIAREPFPGIEAYAKAAKGFIELRYNPSVSIDTNSIEILSDRVYMKLFSEPYFVVEIINKELAKNYQTYFDYLWAKSRRA